MPESLDAPARSVARSVLSLQTRMWLRGVRSNPSSIFLNILIALYTVLLLVFAMPLMWMAIALHKFQAVWVVIAAGMLAYIVIAIVLPSVDGRLQVSHYAMFPLRPRDLMPAAAVSNLLQTRGILAAFCTLVTLVVGSAAFLTSRNPLGLVLFIVGCLVAFVTTVFGGEALVGLISGGSSRSRKERTAIVAALGFAIIIFGFSYLSSFSSSLDLTAISLGLWTDIIAWTPFGAAPAAAMNLSQGLWLPGLGQLVIAAVTVGLACWAWSHQIAAGFIAPLDADSSRSSGTAKQGADAMTNVVLPGLPYRVEAAVYSRAIRYLRRDVRMLGSVLILPIVCLYFLFMGARGDDGEGTIFIYMGAFLLAVFAGSLSCNDFGYDGPSSWLHLSAPLKAKQFVIPRHFSGLTVSAAMLVIYLVVVFVISDSTFAAASTAVGSVGLMMASAGVGVTMSVFNPFPTARPGTNPWKDRGSFSGAALLSSFASILVGWIPLVPGGICFIVGNVQDSGMLIGIGFALLLAVPAACYAVALRVACSRVDKAFPEVFDKVRNFNS